MAEADLSAGGKDREVKLGESIECEGQIWAEIDGFALEIGDYPILGGYEEGFIVLGVREVFEEAGF